MLCSQQFTDLASLSALAKYTTGGVYCYPGFIPARDASKLQSEIKHNLTRQTGVLSSRQLLCHRSLAFPLPTDPFSFFMYDVTVLDVLSACSLTHSHTHLTPLLAHQMLHHSKADVFSCSCTCVLALLLCRLECCHPCWSLCRVSCTVQGCESLGVGFSSISDAFSEAAHTAKGVLLQRTQSVFHAVPPSLDLSVMP